MIVNNTKKNWIQPNFHSKKVMRRIWRERTRTIASLYRIVERSGYSHGRDYSCIYLTANITYNNILNS